MMSPMPESCWGNLIANHCHRQLLVIYVGVRRHTCLNPSYIVSRRACYPTQPSSRIFECALARKDTKEVVQAAADHEPPTSRIPTRNPPGRCEVRPTCDTKPLTARGAQLARQGSPCIIHIYSQLGARPAQTRSSCPDPTAGGIHTCCRGISGVQTQHLVELQPGRTCTPCETILNEQIAAHHPRSSARTTVRSSKDCQFPAIHKPSTRKLTLAHRLQPSRSLSPTPS